MPEASVATVVVVAAPVVVPVVAASAPDGSPRIAPSATNAASLR